jgi:hypothetical protein
VTYNPDGYNLEIYHGGQRRQVERLELGEQRMVVKMTISEYHLLMKEFEAHIVKARGVGREEGVSLMEVLIVQLTSLTSRLYQEGQALNEEYQSLYNTFNRERQITTQKIETIRREFQAEVQAYIATTTTRLEQQVLDERALTERAVLQEREAAKMRLFVKLPSEGHQPPKN